MIGIRAAALTLASLTLVPLAAPVQAQSLSADLRALDEQLPGDLVNDPSRIDWDSYGPEFYAESIVDESIPGGGAARRFHVSKATEFIYTAGTNIPLIRNVKRGTQITIGFWARTVEAATEDGKGVLRVRFQRDSPPYPGFGEKTLEIGSAWDWYEVTAEAEQTLRRKDGIVSIQFGRTKQVLEIGQAIVVSGASSIARTAAGTDTQPTQAPPSPPTPTLPGPVQGTGELINDPSDRNWGFAATEGAAVDARDDSTIWLGKATRLTTGTDDAAGVDGLVAVGTPLAEGDELLIALAAKSVSTSTEEAGSTLEVRLAVPSGDETIARSSIQLGTSWQLVRMKATAPRVMPAGEVVVGLRVVGPDQGVDVGPVYVIKTGSAGQ